MDRNGIFYVVTRGHTPGIYTNKESVDEVTSGYPGASYTSFPTRREAEQYLTNMSLTARLPRTPKWQPPALPLVDRTIVYAEASRDDNGTSGYGIVIIKLNGEVITDKGRVPFVCSIRVAELYALLMAITNTQDKLLICTSAASTLRLITDQQIVIEDNLVAQLIQLIHEHQRTRSILFNHVVYEGRHNVSHVNNPKTYAQAKHLADEAVHGDIAPTESA